MSSLLWFLDRALTVYIYVILFRVLWSWTAMYPYNPYVQRAYRPPYIYVLRAVFLMVDPLVKPLRRHIPFGRESVVDAGPAILVLIVILVQLALRRLAMEMMMQ